MAQQNSGDINFRYNNQSAIKHGSRNTLDALKITVTDFILKIKNYQGLLSFLFQVNIWLPNSLKTKESVWTLSLNLYVSQQTSTGTLLALAISEMRPLPTRDITKPLANRPCAPRNTLVAWKDKRILCLFIVHNNIQGNIENPA